MRRWRGVTIVELIVVFVVIGTILTIGFPAYQNMIDSADAKACAANQQAIKYSLDALKLEGAVIPATLSELPEDVVRKAFARLYREPGGWQLKLSKFISGIRHQGIAYAQINKGTPGGLRCPRAASGEISYGINSLIAGQSVDVYRELGDEITVIADCSAATFTGDNDPAISARHVRYNFLVPVPYAIRVIKEDKVIDWKRPQRIAYCRETLSGCRQGCAPPQGRKCYQDETCRSCRHACRKQFKSCIGSSGQ
jgi:type II secretory pathway pseudopilin PulG